MISSLQVLGLSPPAEQGRTGNGRGSPTLQPRLPCCNPAQTQQSSPAHRTPRAGPALRTSGESSAPSQVRGVLATGGLFCHNKSKSSLKTDSLSLPILMYGIAVRSHLQHFKDDLALCPSHFLLSTSQLPRIRV